MSAKLLSIQERQMLRGGQRKIVFFKRKKKKSWLCSCTNFAITRLKKVSFINVRFTICRNWFSFYVEKVNVE